MIETQAKQLKLAYIKQNHEQLIQEAVALNRSYEEFLDHILTLRSGTTKKYSYSNAYPSGKTSAEGNL